VGNKSHDELPPPKFLNKPEPAAWEVRHRQNHGAWSQWEFLRERPNIERMKLQAETYNREYEYRELKAGPITHVKRNKKT
jgi:hypothetical protein